MVTISFIKLSIFLGIMSSQTKRYWTIYSTSKGEFQINLGNLINVLPQVLHRLQNKEKPMQNNFYSPVRVTQNDFRVQHCKV